MKWLGPGMLSEHEDNPCYRVAHNWTFLEKQVWVWILRDIKEVLLISTGTQETVLSATEVSQYLEGPLKNPRPYFDFATCTVPFLMILFRICVSGAGHDPQHNSSGLQNEKKKKKARWLMFVCVISGVTSSDMDASTSNTLQAGVSIDWKIYCGSWLFLFLSLFFDILPFLVLNNSAISVSQGNKQETKYWKVEQEKLSVPLSEPGVLGDSTKDTGRV